MIVMKPHRIFIAINVPEEVKDKLLAYKKKWAELPARWTSKDNVHLTLAFLGNRSDQELVKVCDAMKQVGLRHKPFTLAINRIVYGSPRLRSGQAAKMIWALIEKSPELLALQKDVEKTLGPHDSEPFSPHLTLARLRAFEFQRMEREEIPDIDEEISVSFAVKSIEVMESALKRSGSEYTIIQSFVLKR